MSFWKSSELLTDLCCCRGILRKMGLAGRITPDQVAKKWDNLKTKYKVRTCCDGYEPPQCLMTIGCRFKAQRVSVSVHMYQPEMQHFS